MILPRSHPSRVELNDEVHARPPEALTAPSRLSYLALFCGPDLRGRSVQHLRDLIDRYRGPPPPPDANHYTADLGPFRLKWERHTEFVRYKIIVPGVPDGDRFDDPAIGVLPPDWLAEVPGQVLVAAHAVLIAEAAEPIDTVAEVEAVARRMFDGNVLIGAAVAGGAATALTDFRIRSDGFSRFLIRDRDTTPRQAGRIVQRLMEIDTYRMLALLALPIARRLAPFLAESEQELAQVTGALVGAGEADEAVLLDRLTRLEAAIESRQADNVFRFAAAEAYYDLVQQRIAELREERIPGLQTFREFTDRRLTPATSTTRSAAQRQESLSQRLARATQLLSTRVDVTRERQNQEVLASLDRRAKVQLRLQETVEGLSIAALTYYIVGLVGYAVKGLKASGLEARAGIEVSAEVVQALSIPVVLLLTAWGVARVRRRVMRDA